MRFSEPPISAIGIIPARLASQRLPNKPLAILAGKPILQWVWERSNQSELLSKVVVACDSEEVAELCKKIGAEYIMTPPDLPSGTDRIAYAVKYGNLQADTYINIQGDEPFISGSLLDLLFRRFAISLCDVGTLVTKITNHEDLHNPNVVKVVTATDNSALYFSRSPIPYYRELEKELWHTKHHYYKHFGIYAYSPEALEKFTNLPQTDLEIAERLEQLRLMQNNVKFICIETDQQLYSIDTQDDLDFAESKAELLLK